MNEPVKKTSAGRPLWLSVVFCLAVLGGGADLLYGTGSLGFLLLMVAGGIFAVILSACRRLLAFVDGLAALAVLYVLSMNIQNGYRTVLVCAVFLVLALILYAAVRKRAAKTVTVLLLSVGMLAFFLILFFAFRAADGKSLSPTVIMEEINALFDTFLKEMQAAMTALVDALPAETKASYEAQTGAGIETFSALLCEFAALIVETVKLLSIGLILFAVQALCYLAVAAFSVTVKASRCEVIFPETRWVLYPTTVTAVLFYVVSAVYLLSMFLSGTVATGIHSVTANLLLILLPGMTACGVRGMVGRIRNPRTRRGMIVLVVLIVIGVTLTLWLAVPVLFLILALLGAKDTIAARGAEAPSNKDGE